MSNFDIESMMSAIRAANKLFKTDQYEEGTKKVKQCLAHVPRQHYSEVVDVLIKKGYKEYIQYINEDEKK